MTEVAAWIREAFEAYCRGEDAGVRVKIRGQEWPDRVVCIDSSGMMSVLVLYRGGGCECACYLDNNGAGDDRTLLPPKPKPLEGWVNVYENGYGGLYKTAEDARNGASSDVLRAVHMREVVGEDA